MLLFWGTANWSIRAIRLNWVYPAFYIISKSNASYHCSRFRKRLSTNLASVLHTNPSANQVTPMPLIRTCVNDYQLWEKRAKFSTIFLEFTCLEIELRALITLTSFKVPYNLSNQGGSVLAIVRVSRFLHAARTKLWISPGISWRSPKYVKDKARCRHVCFET